MKLKKLIPIGSRPQLILTFGTGKLVRWYDRKGRCHRHEFIGGTDADCREALLWASLFAHGITFNSPSSPRPAAPAIPACRPQRKRTGISRMLASVGRFAPATA